ncbi:MAG: hypothetical protein EBS68_17580 [Rhodobacteraceae bacterium]|nr:hypothetical protein [Paracoccaceae bacterium]
MPTFTVEYNDGTKAEFPTLRVAFNAAHKWVVNGRFGNPVHGQVSDNTYVMRHGSREARIIQ